LPPHQRLEGGLVPTVDKPCQQLAIPQPPGIAQAGQFLELTQNGV
jgi:hypothetical protein